MTQTIFLGALTLIASWTGTATGFGTSTIMMPVLAYIFPVPVALLFVGIIHLAGNVWKVFLFRTGFDGKLVFGFGLAGIVSSYLGASFSFAASDLPLKQILGAFLIL